MQKTELIASDIVTSFLTQKSQTKGVEGFP